MFILLEENSAPFFTTEVFQITKIYRTFLYIPQAPNHKNLQLNPAPWQADTGKGD